MKIVKEQDGVNLEVIPRRFTDKEVVEITNFIKLHKTDKIKNAKIEVTPASQKEYDLLVALLEKMNIKWTLLSS